MPAYLRILRIPYEEPHNLHLQMKGSNGRMTAALEFYAHARDLVELGQVLQVFPRHVGDEHVWEIGSENPDDRWAFHFRFRASTLDSRGSCALQLRFSNNQAPPECEVAEFCIAATASQINTLGRFIAEFSQLRHEFLEWTVGNTWIGERP